jgi:uncharacterized protein with PQ loop repeat
MIVLFTIDLSLDVNIVYYNRLHYQKSKLYRNVLLIIQETMKIAVTTWVLVSYLSHLIHTHTYRHKSTSPTPSPRSFYQLFFLLRIKNKL